MQFRLVKICPREIGIILRMKNNMWYKSVFPLCIKQGSHFGFGFFYGAYITHGVLLNLVLKFLAQVFDQHVGAFFADFWKMISLGLYKEELGAENRTNCRMLSRKARKGVVSGALSFQEIATEYEKRGVRVYLINIDGPRNLAKIRPAGRNEAT